MNLMGQARAVVERHMQATISTGITLEDALRLAQRVGATSIEMRDGRHLLFGFPAVTGPIVESRVRLGPADRP